MGRGDHVYTWYGAGTEEGILGFYHHGIDDGRGSIYHYSSYQGEKTLKNGVIRKTAWTEFISGSNSKIHTVRYTNPDSADVIIARAESKLGQGGYNLLLNNCEHFCRWLWELIFNDRLLKNSFSDEQALREKHEEICHTKPQSRSPFDAYHNVNWILRRVQALPVVIVIAIDLIKLRNPLISFGRQVFSFFSAF